MLASDYSRALIALGVWVMDRRSALPETNGIDPDSRTMTRVKSTFCPLAGRWLPNIDAESIKVSP